MPPFSLDVSANDLISDLAEVGCVQIRWRRDDSSRVVGYLHADGRLGGVTLVLPNGEWWPIATGQY